MDGNLDNHDTFYHFHCMDFVFLATFSFLDGVSKGLDGAVEAHDFAKKNLFDVSTDPDA